jgi:hypothetical protein
VFAGLIVTATLADRERSALDAFRLARSYRSKGARSQELTVLLSGSMALLSAAVAVERSPEDARAYLVINGLGDALSRAALLNRDFHSALLAEGRSPGAVTNGITPVHAAWLLKEWDTGGAFLEPCLSPEVASVFPLTRFWKEYHRAIGCLSALDPYEPAPLKLTGYEKYWAVYLKLIQELTHRRQTGPVLEEATALFNRRNRDKRLHDHAMLDGDGRSPVAWDFRRASIMTYWTCEVERAGEREDAADEGATP